MILKIFASTAVIAMTSMLIGCVSVPCGAPTYAYASSQPCCQTFYRCYTDLRCPYYYHCVRYSSYYDYLYKGDPAPDTSTVIRAR